jgi:glycosyltransferase involved in cell wall biosynthesis
LIVRVLFAANELHFPDNMGGSRMDTHDLALALQDGGHEVTVLATVSGRNRLLGYRILETLTGKCLLRCADTSNGYETIRCGSWRIPRFLGASIDRQRPELMITQGPGGGTLAMVAARRGVPAVMRLTSAAEVEWLARAACDDGEVAAALASPLVKMAAVSHFVATLAADQLGFRPAVIYPPIRSQACMAPEREPAHVTFVNPIPMKGLEIAQRVAELLPHRRFVFAEAWNIYGAQRAALDRALSGLPNVSFRPRSVGLADLYRSTALLLVPSQCPEALSRVVLEACVNGIPVLASRLGGVPEAMGNSGILIEASAPPQRWAQAVEEVLADQNRMDTLVSAALANAQRAEFEMSFIAAQYLALAEMPAGAVVRPG